MKLHLIQRSPYSNKALEDCLNIIGEHDSILLMEDGVFAINSPLITSTKHKIFALQDDVQARGLTKFLKTEIECISTNQFVELCTQNKQIISWY